VATPSGTYRVQVSPDFDLYATADLAPYLAALGVSHLYSSPLLAAAPGSAHGYDVVDHTQADPQRGGEAGRTALAAALRAHGLGLVLDLVPNHAGVGRPQANPAWWDLLRLGPESAFADWFDVDWSGGKLLLPVLSETGDELEDLVIEQGALRLGDARYPLRPGTEGAGNARAALAEQHYALVPHTRALREHSYRRFFAISSLAGLRVEDKGVFMATHTELLRWVADGDADGLRIDHPDGLADPAGYLAMLAGSAPGCWLVVEKILEPGERLPASWPVAGTTGYDALSEVDGVLVDPAAAADLSTLDEELTGVRTDWPELAHACKLDVATGMLNAEVQRLAALAAGVPDAAAALAELLASFPVYRSYLPVGAEHLAAALDAARRRRPDLDAAYDALAPRLSDPGDPLAVRFQQTSGAVMAKGVEDTAYYRWTRFIAANEVGGDPARIGLPLAGWHQAQADRQRYAPAGMTTLSTHDTKRSEDVRARLAVLAEIPADWAATVRRWAAAAPVPDGAQAHLLWQTIAGAWPIERDRLHGAVGKAIREARTATNWITPDAAFEAAVHAAIDAAYDSPALTADIDGFVSTITPDGWANSLSAKLLQLTMPGVPDVYQGCELWDNSLVDPDNRRPVDFAARRDYLARLDAGWSPPVDATGAAKLLVTSRALRARRDHPDRFTSYTPLAATGAAADHLVAYDRGGAITAATRLPVALRRAGGWTGTTLDLPPGGWTDALTRAEFAGRTPVGELLARYPVALLLRT
jgi:(1->4)-alpha-D-glucan 1-alpha-D-glucosylmutase